MDKRGVLVIIILLVSFVCAETFIDQNSGDFDLGVYDNTTYNGSALVLYGENVSGVYTSQIFNSGSFVSWDFLNWTTTPDKNSLWVLMSPSYAEDEFGGDITSAVQNLGGSSTWERVEVQSWDKGLGEGDILDSVYAYCHAFYFDTGAYVGFQVSTDFGSTWSQEGCFQEIISDKTSYRCDLTSSFDIDTVNELNSLYFRCTFPNSTQGNFYSTDWVNLLVSYNASFFYNNSGANLSRTLKVFSVDGSGDVYNSEDLGFKWRQTLAGYGRNTDTIDMFSYGSLIYILSNSNKEVWKSVDGGASFSVINGTFSDNALLLGDSDSNGNLFVVDGSGDVYRSMDDGTTWTLESDFNNAATNNALGIAINSSNVVFVVDGSGDVYSSTGINLGNFNSTYFSQDIYGVTYNSNGLFVVTKDKAVHKSTDNGATWNLINSTAISGEPRGIVSDDLGNLYVSTKDEEIYKSMDVGFTWELLVQPFTDKDCANEYGLGYDGNYLYAFDNDKDVWRSADGISWNEINDAYFSQDIYGVTYNSNGLFVVTKDKAVHKSTDNGATWNLINSGLGVAQEPRGMASIGSVLYLLTRSSEIYRSSDGGLTWVLVSSYSSNDNANQHGVIGDGSSLYAFDNSRYVWKSNNNLGWVKVNDSYGGSTGTDGMEVDSFGNLYILLNTKIYSSQDYGATWNVLNDSISPYANTLVEMEIDREDNFFILDAIGRVFRSQDFGYTWKEIGDVNGGESNDPKGITTYIPYTDLRFQVRNCSLFDCSDANFVGEDGTNQSFFTNLSSILDKNSEFFQYKAFFSSGDSSFSPELYNVSLVYTILNSAPVLDVLLPINGTGYGLNDVINLNFTVVDLDNNLDSCWYNVEGVNVSIGNCENMSFLASSLGFGSYNLFVYANDSEGEEVSDSISFDILNSAPTIILIEPAQANYSVGEDIPINYSIFDLEDGVDSCWYDFGSGNISIGGCANFTLNLGSGSYNLFIYVNDSEGLLGLDNASFNVVNSVPSVSILHPQLGSTLGYNDSINLNFTVVDLDNNLDSCWYNVEGVNVSIGNCENMSFGVVGDGHYDLILYANDSEGEFSYDEIDFYVQLGAPTINLVYPIGGFLNYSQNIVFSYVPEDIDLETCELWGNFSGFWAMDQLDLSPENGATNNFSLNLSDGSYKWNIRCNDSFGNFAFNGNKSFYVDTTFPQISLSDPTGTKTTRNNLPLNFQLSELNKDSCWYNVYRGGNIEIDNRSLSCTGGSSTFNVTVDADFTLNFYVNDSAGNLNTTSSNFVVNTVPASSSSSSSSSSSGGSSSGGSYAGVSTKPDLTLEDLSGLKVNEGGVKKVLTLSVENTGTSYLNDCVFKSLGDYSSWVTHSEKKGLAAGEQYEVVFDVNLPEEIGVGTYGLEVSFACKEITKTKSFEVEVLGKQLNFELINVERDGQENVKVAYSLEDIAGENQDVELQFLLFDLDNKKVAEFKDVLFVPANQKKDFESFISIPSDLEGELSLLININSDTYSGFVQENVLLGAPLSGFAVLGDSAIKNNVISGVIVLLFLTFAILIVKNIRKHHKIIKYRPKPTKKRFWRKNK